MMNSSEWVLKAILNRYPAASRESLERLLPKNERERLDAMPSFSPVTDVDEPPLLGPRPLVVAPFHFGISDSSRSKTLLSALSPHAKENLCRELKIKTPPSEEIGRTVREFAIHTLEISLTGEPSELLPVYFLPPTPLKSLLGLDKQQLVQLIDSLSLIDLAIELRQIVETKILKKNLQFSF